MGFPKGPELLIILLIILLLFGARKIPELARSFGRSARELRRGFEEEDPAEAQIPSVGEGGTEAVKAIGNGPTDLASESSVPSDR